MVVVERREDGRAYNMEADSSLRDLLPQTTFFRLAPFFPSVRFLPESPIR